MDKIYKDLVNILSEVKYYDYESITSTIYGYLNNISEEENYILSYDGDIFSEIQIIDKELGRKNYIEIEVKVNKEKYYFFGSKIILYWESELEN